MDRVRKSIGWIREKNLYPQVHTVQSPHAPELFVDGKKVLMFATNNYLGVMTDQRVKDAAAEGAQKWGIGSGSARLLTGNLEINQQLEDAIANFKYRPAALTFISGYAANEGAIPALVNILEPDIVSLVRSKISKSNNTIIFSDEYNHASIITGVRLSGAKKEVYKHRDIDDLKRKLEKAPKRAHKFIITDGVFSMDGDVAPLPEILNLAKEHDALVYLDDAHATGILGQHGRGIEDYFDVEGESDVVMGTFTKAFGGVGGFVASEDYIIDYLKITAPSFIFTAPIAPPVVCGLLEAIKVVESEPWRREKVLSNAEYLRDKLHENGFDTLNSTTQIIPVLIGDEEKAIKVSEELMEKGIFIPTARWPAVPWKQARLRLTITCDHTTEQIDHLIKTLKEVREKISF